MSHLEGALESWKSEPRRPASRASLYLAAASALACGYRFYRLRHHPEFSDEADNIALGWLLTRGETLYGTIFSHRARSFALNPTTSSIAPPLLQRGHFYRVIGGTFP